MNDTGNARNFRLFLGCFIALIATAFGFAVRAAILKDWAQEFNLSNEQLGYLQGVGLYPFAISIILFSLVVDRIGYGVAMGFAFVGHVISAILTIWAPSFEWLYAATFLYALANGTVESVINPVVASIYSRQKTHWLNILHAGWPGGLVLGGLLAIAVAWFMRGAEFGVDSTTPAEMISQLDSQVVPDVLRQEFADQGASLTQSAKVEVTIAGIEWQIQDEDKAFVVKKRDDTLSVEMTYDRTVWRFQMALVLLPAFVYGILLLGQRFPVQERVAAGVSDVEMLREFGWGSAYICFFLLIAGINQILQVAGVVPLEQLSSALVTAVPTLKELIPWEGVLIQLLTAAIALVPTVLFAIPIRSFGRPMFVFLLLIMVLLATTELGTDSWISDIMRAVLVSETKGTLFLVYTSLIMFILRFFAGPIVHRITPLGLLATCAAIACVGLLWLSWAGNLVWLLILAATLYGFGKTFFWPTTLGLVSEQYPKGGALMLNAVAGVGMIAVGTLGNPAIGYFQDRDFDQRIKPRFEPAVYQRIMKEEPGLFGTLNRLNQEGVKELNEAQRKVVDAELNRAKQATLAKVAVLPAIMFVCYLILIGHFVSRGGYKAQELEPQVPASG